MKYIISFKESNTTEPHSVTVAQEKLEECKGKTWTEKAHTMLGGKYTILNVSPLLPKVDIGIQ